jgi:ketosteroid isomerase-like protein
MSRENLEMLRVGYEAFNRRDLTALGPLLHPGFEVDLTHSMGFDKGRYAGEEGLREFFESFWEAFDSIAIEPEEYIGNGDRIVAIIRARGRGYLSGVEVDARGPHLWSFCDGRVIGLALYEHLDEALEAAGLSE